MALTSNDVDLIIERMKLTFPTKMDLEDALDKQESRINQKYNKVINRLDAVMGELQTKRDEQEAHAKQHIDINDKLEAISAKLKLDLNY